MTDAPLTIDGAYGEGGGQVLRSALTLSVLTGRFVRIHNVRANRKNPGLAPQHLTGVLALAKICDAAVDGAEIGSTGIDFQPRSPARSGTYAFDVTHAARGGSAGAVSLVFQTLLLPLSFGASESRVTLMGGTHVSWSPPFHYLTDVYLPTLARMGIRAECRLDAWGFYPVGGGRMAATIDPVNEALRPLSLEARGAVRRIRGIAVACNLPSHIPQRMTNRAYAVLRNGGLSAEILPKRERGPGPGAGMVLAAEYEHAVAGFSAMGQKGKPSDRVADEACVPLLRHHEQGAPVDPHLADQILLPMALADGRSVFRTSRITRHLTTNAHIIQAFLSARIAVDGREDEPGTVVVEGAGIRPSVG